MSSFGQRGRLDALAAARLDFADALYDVHTVAAGAALDRIAVTRSLHELWHLRGEVFDLVSLRHDQAEAERRLADARPPLREAIAPCARWRDAISADGERARRAERSGGSAGLRQRAEEIDLAELDAVVAQQRVRRRHVEEEVRQREVLEVRLARHA